MSHRFTQPLCYFVMICNLIFIASLFNIWYITINSLSLCARRIAHRHQFIATRCNIYRNVITINIYREKNAVWIVNTISAERYTAGCCITFPTFYSRDRGYDVTARLSGAAASRRKGRGTERKGELVGRGRTRKRRGGGHSQRAQRAWPAGSLRFLLPGLSWLQNARIVRNAVESSFAEYSVWTIAQLLPSPSRESTEPSAFVVPSGASRSARIGLHFIRFFQISKLLNYSFSLSL